MVTGHVGQRATPVDPREGIGWRVVLCIGLCAAITLLLWRVLDPWVLVAGTALGCAAGAMIGIVVASRRLPTSLRAAATIAIVWGAAAAAAGDIAGPLRIPRVMSTFLTVGVPASGLTGLAAVATTVALPGTALTVWGSLSGRGPAMIGGAVATLIAASLLAAPRHLPILPLVAAGGFLVALLFVVAERGRSQLPPLLDGDHLSRRRPWPAALAVGAIAVGAGAVTLLAPHVATFDLRAHVRPEVTEIADENPLATAARLAVDPPGDASDVDVTVTVEGPSPGRMRVAVLDQYEPTGWRQSAAFAETGRALADSPLYGEATGASTSVRLAKGPGMTGLRAVPTAGDPLRVSDPNGVLFAANAGVLYDTAGAVATTDITYRSVPRPGDLGTAAPAITPGVPSRLYGCPSTGAVREVATAMAAGTTDPVVVLRRIEAWIKLTRIYDPRALGGQTLASVESFAGLTRARGNMEVFVSTFALVARCAGVPTRVVVGYPAPPANAITQFTPRQLVAWVEVPLAGTRWFAVDPVPNADEQQRQAELAEQPSPPAAPPTATPVPPAPEVTPVRPHDASGSWWPWIGLGLAGAVALALLGMAMMPWLTGRRRRRATDPGDAVLGAWNHTVERLLDRGVPLLDHQTPTEVGLATNGRVPRRVSQLVAALAPITDRARYHPEGVTADHAGTAWALADAIRHRLPGSVTAKLAAVTHPTRTIRRLRAAGSVPRGRHRWDGSLPAEVTAADEASVANVPGVQLDTQIGVGSTSTVFRGHLLDDGRAVAVKVFRFPVDVRPFDRQRFEWEARVAGMMSGQLNLPETYASGITASGQPYLVTKLYARGTLASRVHRGGPLSAGEIVALGRTLAVALDTLHRSSILHGDVKPENVFIDDDGTPVLGDLGSAWVRADGGPAASMTPPYAAPEIWLGQHPSKMSDLYSLGLTLMFCATGRAPIAGAPPQADDVLEALGSEIYLPLLEVDPRRRPRTALDAARLLGADVDDPSLAWRTALVLPTPTIVRQPRATSPSTGNQRDAK